MKLTPLDIHHKEFRHKVRGYSEEEVDAFLDEVADEFERLFKENIDASEKLEASQEKLRQFQEQEQTIRNTMVSAQRSGEEIVGKANEEAVTVLRDAEVKAKEIIHNALTQKQQVQTELVRIKQAEEEFRAKFRNLLEQHAQELSEVKLPDDVNVLMGDADAGVVGEVEIADVVAPAPEPQAPAPAPQPEPPAPAPAAAEPAPAPVPEQAELSAEPPESGFVTSVTLGETEAPDVESGDVEMSEPKEFSIGSFDELGEREDDIDIEEID